MSFLSVTKLFKYTNFHNKYYSTIKPRKENTDELTYNIVPNNMDLVFYPNNGQCHSQVLSLHPNLPLQLKPLRPSNFQELKYDKSSSRNYFFDGQYYSTKSFSSNIVQIPLFIWVTYSTNKSIHRLAFFFSLWSSIMEIPTRSAPQELLGLSSSIELWYHLVTSTSESFPPPKPISIFIDLLSTSK